MEEERKEELVDRFLESMGVIMRLRRNAFRKAMGRHGVTLPQFFLLKVLGVRGEMTVTEVAQCMMVAVPTASRMIDKLCARGFLERRKDPANRRLTLVRPTRKGRGAVRSLGEIHKEELLRMMEDFPAEELESLVRQLEDLVRRLGPAPGGSGG